MTLQHLIGSALLALVTLAAARTPWLQSDADAALIVVAGRGETDEVRRLLDAGASVTAPAPHSAAWQSAR